jgi:two-component system NarL family sensor kinase
MSGRRANALYPEPPHPKALPLAPRTSSRLATDGYNAPGRRMRFMGSETTWEAGPSRPPQPYKTTALRRFSAATREEPGSSWRRCGRHEVVRTTARGLEFQKGAGSPTRQGTSGDRGPHKNFAAARGPFTIINDTIVTTESTEEPCRKTSRGRFLCGAFRWADLIDTNATERTELARGAGIRFRAAARLAWTLWAACVVLIVLALLLDFGRQEPFPFRTGDRLSPSLAVLTGALSLAYPTVGALIASRLPRNPIGWIFCGSGLLYAAQRFTGDYADYVLLENFSWPGGEYVAWFSTSVGGLPSVLVGVFVMLLFPDGHLPSRRWRTVAWVAIFGAACGTLGDALMPGSLRTHFYVNNPFGVVGTIGGFTTYELFAASSFLGTALVFASNLGALLSLLLRLHRARGEERQQLKWLLYAAVPAAFCLSVILLQHMVVNYTTNFLFDPRVMVSWEVLVYVLYAGAFASLAVPVCTYIAILRHHLYDIDAVINRTLVYGALSACVVGIYVLAVGGFGALFQARGNLGVSLLATGVVALLFQPLRSKLQRGINRLMYGERDDPYAVISRLGRRLEATLAPDAVLPTVVETIAQALKLPYAAVLLKEGEGFRTAAAYGTPAGETEALPLVYQREEIGRLVLAPRAPGEGFTDADRRLLEDLARQAEVAVHAVRLTADLQRSRERLVATREEERRRLRRDLHDGIGPTLTGLALQLNAARKLVLRNEPKDAEETLARLEERTSETLSEMRRLIYGLRPPALDDLGLVPSICQQAQIQGMVDAPTKERWEDGPVFSMEAPEPLPPLPAAVEVACYRIAQEAIANVARHARAETCRVRLSVERGAGVLEMEITDNGVGIPEDYRAGVGLSSMRERAEELGGTLTVEPGPAGGTRVLARLPLPIPGAHPEGAASSWRAPSVS